VHRAFFFVLSLWWLGCSDASSSGKSTASGGSGGSAGSNTDASMDAGGQAGQSTTDASTGGSVSLDVQLDVPAEAGCVSTATTLVPAGPEAPLAPDYAQYYTAYLLGTVPGMPTGHLGGCTIAATDDNTLLLVGNSETQSAGLWSIGVVRDNCGHIVAWQGQAQKIADAPYMDANLPYTDQGVLLYSQWPVNKLGQLLPGASTPSSETDLLPFGITDSPGGLAFVPSYLAASGELRAAGWPSGFFYHIDYAVQTPPLLTVTGASQSTTVTEGGGFAYVPPGSPGFPTPSLIMAEWSGHAVVTYEVDANGDPLPATRKPFFTSFPAPWGAYFEPVTGDYLFLTWETVPDRVYIVQGFEKPPPPPPPPVPE
jgi:hypothetical protein